MCPSSVEPIQLSALEWDPRAESLRVYPVLVRSDAQIDVGSPLAFDIPPSEGDSAAPPFVTAGAGAHFFLARRPEASAGRLMLERHHLFASEPDAARFELGCREVTALCAFGSRCFVGSVGRIDGIDFGARPPKACWRFEAEDDWARRKAVDSFVVVGRTLIAIDDVITPKLAFVFELKDRGEPEYRFTAKLPEYINETCRQAAASQSKMVLRTTFSHRGGAGQRLLLFDIDQAQLSVTAQLMEIRGTGMFKLGRRRLAGWTHSNWQGLGVLDERVFVGAGERGVLICRTDMCDEDRARVFHPGGICTDLTARAERLYALLTRDVDKRQRSELAVLRSLPEEDSLEVLARHPLPGNPLRFAG